MQWARRVVLLVLVVAVAVVAYQASRTFLALRAAQRDVAAVQGALRAGDGSRARERADDLRHQARAAHGHSDNLLWDGLAAVPVVGDNVDAVQRLSAALDDVGESVPSAVALYGEFRDGRFRSTGGQLNLSAIRQAQPQLSAVARRFGAAAREVEPIRPADLLPGLSGRAAAAVQDLQKAATTVRAADTSARLLPGMLGDPTPRTYLLVAQNNAEIRGSGGLPGSLSLLHTRAGVITLGEQLTVDSYGDGKRPVEAQSPEEKALYGAEAVSNVRDFTLIPDWPTEARRFVALTERMLGHHVDGVISVDPVTLAQMLRVTGPVSGPGGDQVTGENALARLLHEPYQRFESNERQNRYFAGVARSVFTRFTQGQLTPALFSTVAEAVSQRRILVWSARVEEQRLLGGRAAAGELPSSRSSSPQVGFYLNDAAAGKMEYFLRYSTSLTSLSCGRDRQHLRATMTLTSQAPPDGRGLSESVRSYAYLAPPGSMRLQLTVYAPVHGALRGITANGRKVPVTTYVHEDRPAADVTMMLRPQEQVRLVADMEGARQATADPTLMWTPGMTWGPTQRTAPSACS